MTVSESEKKSTRTARAKGAKIGREKKELYFKLKVFALEKEKKNFSKLLVIHEKDNWWKMVGNSAIIFHQFVFSWIMNNFEKFSFSCSIANAFSFRYFSFWTPPSSDPRFRAALVELFSIFVSITAVFTLSRLLYYIIPCSSSEVLGERENGD